MGLFDLEPYRHDPNNDPSGDGKWSLGETLSDYYDFVKGDGASRSLISDSGSDAISKLANDLNVKLNDSTKDYLTQYYFNENSSKNAFNRELQASSTQYQRAVADLRKAGLNPFLAFDSLRGSGASSSAGSTTGGIYTSRKNQDQQSKTQMASSLMSILGIIAAAAIYALA